MAPKAKPTDGPIFRVKIMGIEQDFPLVNSDQFKQGDIRLIAAATGMEWESWLRLLKKHGLNNAVTRQGYFAVAVQRSRDLDADQVVAFIDDLPLVDGVELIFPDVKATDESVPLDEEDDETES